MSLEKKDLELIESLIYRNSDDIAISISRSFERLEKHNDESEARLYSRISELEDKIESYRQDTADNIGDLKEEIRDTIRFRVSPEYN